MSNKRKVQGKLETFFLKRRGVEETAVTVEQETTVNSSSESGTAGSTSATCSVVQPSNEGGSDNSDVRLSQQKYDKPVQPMLESFPRGRHGKRFSAVMYSRYEWVEYSIKEDAVYCFSCRHFAKNAVRKGEVLGSRTFIDRGFSKWSDQHALLEQHQESERHQSSIIAWINFRDVSAGERPSVASQLSENRSAEITENREHVKALLRATRFLGCQGLAFRGHDESQGSENRGNFCAYLEELTEIDDNLKVKLQRRYGHYLSPLYQNDFIRVFGDRVKKTIVDEVKMAKFFSILCDETKDLSRKEQLAVLVRYVHDGVIKERALGVFAMHSLTAEALCNFILAEVNSLGLDWVNCVGQCYDGASVMSGWANGVQARIKNEVPHAVYMHCYAHRLNLVVVHCISDIPEVKEFFDTVQLLYDFISNSNTRHELFITAQKNLNQQVLELERTATTRWLYWYRCISKVILRYEAVLSTLQTAAEIRSGGGASEAAGLLATLESFSFITLLHIMEKLLGITNPLSEQLQQSGLVVVRAESLVSTTRASLQSAREDGACSGILQKAASFSTSVGLESNLNAAVNQPARSRSTRVRKLSKQLTDYLINTTTGQQNVTADGFVTVEQQMSRLYFSVIDRMLAEFDRRFTSNTDLLHSLKAFDASSESLMSVDSVQKLAVHYRVHVDELILHSQTVAAAAYLRSRFPEANCDMNDILSALEVLPVAYSEVIKLVRIAMTIPVTTAGNERFFSVLKRVKTYLRTSTGDERLSHLMLMSVERSLVKSIALDDLVDDFAKLRTRRYPLLE